MSNIIEKRTLVDLLEYAIEGGPLYRCQALVTAGISGVWSIDTVPCTSEGGPLEICVSKCRINGEELIACYLEGGA